jgi:hypothetical protein
MIITNKQKYYKIVKFFAPRTKHGLRGWPATATPSHPSAPSSHFPWQWEWEWDQDPRPSPTTKRFPLFFYRKNEANIRPADGDRLPTCIGNGFLFVGWAKSFGPLLA